MQHCRTRTFKMLGPWIFSKLFSKPVPCVAHHFCEFCKEADHCFPQFRKYQQYSDNFLKFILKFRKLFNCWFVFYTNWLYLKNIFLKIKQKFVLCTSKLECCVEIRAFDGICPIVHCPILLYLVACLLLHLLTDFFFYFPKFWVLLNNK